jgi:hypothetical protein
MSYRGLNKKNEINLSRCIYSKGYHEGKIARLCPALAMPRSFVL